MARDQTVLSQLHPCWIPSIQPPSSNSPIPRLLQYQGTYGARRLQAWADLTAKWAASGRTVYHALNNDSISPGARLPSAILDCRSLAGALRKMGQLG